MMSKHGVPLQSLPEGAVFWLDGDFFTVENAERKGPPSSDPRPGMWCLRARDEHLLWLPALTIVWRALSVS